MAEEPNEQRLLIDQDRAQKAEALLDNPLLREAFASLEAEYIEKWKTGNVGPEARERLWNAVTVIAGVRDHLEIMVRNGRLARAALDQLHPNKL